MHLGVMEIVVVVFVAAVCLGPEKLPEYARKIGQKLAEFKQQYSSVVSEFSSGLDEIKDVQDIIRQMQQIDDSEEV